MSRKKPEKQDWKKKNNNILLEETTAIAQGFLEQMLYEALYVPEGEKPFPHTILQEPTIQKYISNWGQLVNDAAIIARFNQQAIGIVWGRTFSAQKPSYGFISEDIPEITIALQSEFRNRGIGSRLLQAIEAYYSQQNISALSLSVDKRSPALRLYIRQGYQLFKEEETAFTMVKYFPDLNSSLTW